jgi:hypothetical protein
MHGVAFTIMVGSRQQKSGNEHTIPRMLTTCTTAQYCTTYCSVSGKIEDPPFSFLRRNRVVDHGSTSSYHRLGVPCRPASVHTDHYRSCSGRSPVPSHPPELVDLVPETSPEADCCSQQATDVAGRRYRCLPSHSPRYALSVAKS